MRMIIVGAQVSMDGVMQAPTLVVALFGSLWPAIALHTLTDLGAGIISWLALRETHATNGVAGVQGGALGQMDVRRQNV